MNGWLAVLTIAAVWLTVGLPFALAVGRLFRRRSDRCRYDVGRAVRDTTRGRRGQ